MVWTCFTPGDYWSDRFWGAVQCRTSRVLGKAGEGLESSVVSSAKHTVAEIRAVAVVVATVEGLDIF